MNASTEPYDLFLILDEIGVTSGTPFGSARRRLSPVTERAAVAAQSKPLVESLLEALDQLRTDKEAVMAKSSVTVADVLALTRGMKALRALGVKGDEKRLRDVVRKVAWAAAGGDRSDQARDAFRELFAGIPVGLKLVDALFEDLWRLILHSNVTRIDLERIEHGRIAVRVAQEALARASAGEGALWHERAIRTRPGDRAPKSAYPSRNGRIRKAERFT